MKKRNKVLLIGWDAGDWKTIGPLLAKGQMPSLKKLINKGVYGNMATMNPPYSPMLWSTVATGKTPDKHGVLGFIELMPDLKGIRPVTVNSRKSRALWNIFHNQGLKSNLVGWWPSFPAEPINGNIVTDKFQKVNNNPKVKNKILEGTVHPKELMKDLRDLRIHPSEITEAHILPFIPKAKNIDQEKNNGIRKFAKIMAENATVHGAATNLMRTTEWDFMAVYYDLIDHFCHAFMKYHPPKLKAIPQDLFDIYKDCINSAYRFQDMMLGRTLDLIDDDTTVIVMSDHGYESDNKRILEMPKYQAAPALEHRQFGIFVAAGPNIKKNEKVFGLGLVDIAPTILHMYDLPIGKDMSGKIAFDIFKEIKPPNYIDSWENVTGDFGEHSKEEKNDQLTDQETMEQLIELGYIERPDEKIEVSILKTKCDLKHNLARVYIGKKEFDKAKRILLELIEEKEPVDVIPYFMSLLSISLKEKEFDKAEIYLNELKTRDKKFKINTYFSEAKILLNKNKVKEALDILNEAKNRKPNSEVWYQIAKVHMAIELIKYFPDAHYTLGEALEKLGDSENAKKAYETAARLKPKTYHRAEKAIENINEKTNSLLKFNDKNYSKYKEDQIVIVSGLPRSGTSLIMQMLEKGGKNILTDTNRKADISNPKGYYEYDPVMALHKDNNWLHLAKNKSVKIVAPLLKFIDPKYRYKVIFINRDLNEVIQSQQKMIGKDPKTLPLTLFEAYKKILKQVDIWKDKEPGVELIYIDYKETINNPKGVVEKIVSFIGEDMDKAQMQSCIDKTLYRNKK